jgi:hypothetical protein
MLLTASSKLDLLTFIARVAAEREKPEAERNPQLINSAPGIQRRLVAISERKAEVERQLCTYLFSQPTKLPETQKISTLEKRFGGLAGNSRRRVEAQCINTLIADDETNSAAYFAGLASKSLADLRALNKPLIDFALRSSWQHV